LRTETFTVDASLLEELGERLIGRAPIALAELVKSPYDADSSICRIHFSDNSIVVEDDGLGISQEEFQKSTSEIEDSGYATFTYPYTQLSSIARVVE
jgi:hypothetical protein